MNTKFCRHCGKELPVESVFCPYCMTKLIDVKTGEPIKSDKKKFIIPIVIITIVIIAAVSGVILFFVSNSNNEADTTNQANVTVVSTETEKAEKLDYTQYVGIWTDKNGDTDIFTENGGILLEIISVNDDVVRFTFTKISSSAYNRIARISNVTSKIIDGIGTFTFDNDNWLNSGTGKIKFSDDEIYLETNITRRNDSAMWDIGGKFYLMKSDNSLIDFKNSEFLGTDFDEVKHIFGEERDEVISASDKWDIYTYSGFDVAVLKETNKIVGITVTYSSNNITKTNLCYGNINGTSTYDDVYAEMGEPSYNSITYGDVSYVVDGNYINFTFDENMVLTGFTLQLENTH